MITELSADSMLISGELNIARKYLHPHRIPNFSMIESISFDGEVVLPSDEWPRDNSNTS